MKVFVAGATGAVGRRLVPLLTAHGHEVVGLTRSPEKIDALRRAGAEPVVADALDRAAIREAVLRAEPDAVIHQLTALDGMGGNLRRFERDFALTDRLRTEGTDNLLAAAWEVGVTRIVAQSFTGWPYARTGGPVKTEDDPLDPTPAAPMRRTLAAIRHLEESVTAIGGVALRYGFLYGPGTSLGEGGAILDTLRARRFPVIGDGAGVWSFTHVDDAAGAAWAALDHGAADVYNVVDDEPAPVATWLPALCDAIDAPPPRHVPAWLGRLLAGEVALVLSTQIRGAANARARRELGWQPAYPSWREGFRTGLSDAAPTVWAGR
jgi:nucleoside-diphosphate-sugar epimerase